MTLAIPETEVAALLSRFAFAEAAIKDRFVKVREERAMKRADGQIGCGRARAQGACERQAAHHSRALDHPPASDLEHFAAAPVRRTTSCQTNMDQ